MSWINWMLGKTDVQKEYKSLEEMIKNQEKIVKCFEMMIEKQNQLYKDKLEYNEYKIKSIESFLDKITSEIDSRLKRLEREISLFDYSNEPKKKAGRPKKDKSK